MSKRKRRSNAEIKRALARGENEFSEEETTGVIEMAAELLREGQEEHQRAVGETARTISQEIAKTLKDSAPPPPIPEPEGT